MRINWNSVKLCNMFNSHLLEGSGTRGGSWGLGSLKRADQPPSSTVSGIWWQVSSVSASKGSSRRHSWGVGLHEVTELGKQKERTNIKSMDFLSLIKSDLSWHFQEQKFYSFEEKKSIPLLESLIMRKIFIFFIEQTLLYKWASLILIDIKE